MKYTFILKKQRKLLEPVLKYIINLAMDSLNLFIRKL